MPPERPTAAALDEAIIAWAFAIAVVRSADGRFLLVQEQDNSWYFPGGRLEPGESFEDAALREAHEEAGIPIQLDGVLEIQFTPQVAFVPCALGLARLRVTFLASPLDDSPPKETADRHSRQARWWMPDDLESLDLRGDEVDRWIRSVCARAPTYPLSMFRSEASAEFDGLPGIVGLDFSGS